MMHDRFPVVHKGRQLLLHCMLLAHQHIFDGIADELGTHWTNNPS